MADNLQPDRGDSAGNLPAVSGMPCIYIPDEIVRRRDLRAGDKMLFGFLASRRYSIADLAAIMNRTPKTIRRRVRLVRLEPLGSGAGMGRRPGAGAPDPASPVPDGALALLRR